MKSEVQHNETPNHLSVVGGTDVGGAANTSVHQKYQVSSVISAFRPEYLPHLNNRGPKLPTSPAPGKTEMAEPTREEFNAKLEAAESRMESAVTRLETQISRLPTAAAIRSNIWGSAAAVIATVIGIFSLWAVGFDSGIQMTTTSVNEAIQARDLSRENAEQLKTLIETNKKRDQDVEAILRILRQGATK